MTKESKKWLRFYFLPFGKMELTHLLNSEIMQMLEFSEKDFKVTVLTVLAQWGMEKMLKMGENIENHSRKTANINKRIQWKF